MVESSRRDFLKVFGLGAIAAAVPLPPAIAQLIEETPVLPTPDTVTYDGLIFERNGTLTKLGNLYQMVIRPPETQEWWARDRIPRYLARREPEPIELEVSALRDEALNAMNIISSYHDTNFDFSPIGDLRGTLYAEIKRIGPRGNKTVRFQIDGVIFRDVNTQFLPPNKDLQEGYMGTPYRFTSDGKPLDTCKIDLAVHYERVNWIEV